LWDAVNTYWNDWVLGYGPELQQALLEHLGFEDPRWQTLLVLAISVTILLLAALTAYLAWSFSRHTRLDEAQLIYLRFCQKLVRVRLVRARQEAPAAFAARASEQRPDLAQTIRAITRTYLHLRYEPGSDPARIAHFRNLVRDFKPAP